MSLFITLAWLFLDCCAFLNVQVDLIVLEQCLVEFNLFYSIYFWYLLPLSQFCWLDGVKWCVYFVVLTCFELTNSLLSVNLKFRPLLLGMRRLRLSDDYEKLALLRWLLQALWFMLIISYYYFRRSTDSWRHFKAYFSRCLSLIILSEGPKKVSVRSWWSLIIICIFLACS